MKPNIWVIGDLQGCHASLVELLARPELQAAEEIWFAGDLLNRGPDSLSTLRTLYNMRDRIRCVLGNHDVHILASIAQMQSVPPTRTAQTILNAPDGAVLLEWLRHLPLTVYEPKYSCFMVHAGILPMWTAAEARLLAQEVEQQLQSPHWQAFLSGVYGNVPNTWQPDLQGLDRARVILNACTRLRYCTPTGVMEFESKEGKGSAPHGYLPWFEAPDRASADTTVIFGHWSSLGLVQTPNLIGTDTGCVWGGQLTAVQIFTRQVVQVACPNYYAQKKTNLLPDTSH